MTKNLLLLILLATAFACTKGASKSKGPLFRLRGAALAGPYSGMLYARQLSSQKTIAKPFSDISGPIELDLENGQWTFALFVWDGASPFTGTFSCFSSSTTLTGGIATIDAALDPANCADAPFGGTDGADATHGFKTVALTTCNTLDHVTSDTSTCNGIKRGFNRSFKLTLFSFNDFTQDAPIPTYVSDCINASPGDGAFGTGLHFPLGGGGLDFPFAIEGYDDFTCSGTGRGNLFLTGADDVRAKVYHTASDIMFFLKDQGADQIVALSSVTGSASGAPIRPKEKITNANGDAIYVYFDGAYRNQLYSTDLTAAGTHPLFPSATVPNYSGKSIFKSGNTAYLVASPDENYAFNLFSFDGLNPVTPITAYAIGTGTPWTPYGIASEVAMVGTTFYFKSYTHNGATNVESICKNDGTLTCALEQAGSSFLTPLGAYNGKYYWFALDSTSFPKLYSHDGSTTVAELDLTPVGISSFSSVLASREINGSLFVWMTAAPKNFLLKIPSSGTPAVVHDQFVYFMPRPDYPLQAAAGTWAVYNHPTFGEVPGVIDPDGNFTLVTSTFSLATSTKIVGEVAGKVMMISDADGGGGTFNTDLYYIDQGDNSVHSVLDLSVDLPAADTDYAVHYSKLWFYADDGSSGKEPYTYDGMTAAQLKDIHTGPGNSINFQPNFYPFNGYVYFAAEDGVSGKELWKSDGTLAGTGLVADINSGASDGKPYGLLASNNYLYFFATDNATFKWFLYRVDNASNVVKVFSSTVDQFSGGGFPWEDRWHFQFPDTTGGTVNHVYIKDNP